MKIKEKEKDEAPSPQPEKVFYDNRIKRKNVLALNEKVAAIREYEKMPVYKRIGRMFHCSPDQIKRIVQQKDNILKAWEQRTRRCQDAKTLELKVVRVSMLGKAVYDWIRRMMYYKDFIITDGLIQKMALQFKSAMGLQNFFPHQEWCDKFRQTYKITQCDSKLLNIGYTQGYSVQIKDVMKDVLSECTPDGEAADNFNNKLDNDDGANDDEDDLMGDSDSDRDFDGINMGNHDTKEHIVLAKTTVPQQPQKRKIITNYQQQQQQQHQNQQQHQQQQSIAMPQLQSIRQLVALPIKTNSGMTQKVLVATPITPGSVQRSGGVVGSGNGAPMTMTIIPITTLATQAQQAQNVGQAVTIGGTGCSSGASGGNGTANTTRNNVSSERPLVPPPILEIKQEIKKEPEDIEIKQEYISEDEAQEIPQDGSPTSASGITAVAAAAAELPEGAAVKVNMPQSKNHRLAGLDDASIIDDDNMALASLRQLIRQPSVPPVISGSGATRTARAKQMTLRRSSNIEQTSPKSLQQQQQTSSLSSPVQKSSTPTESPTTTATLTLRAANSSTPNSTTITTRIASAHKRKRRSSTTPTLPPIQSCSEARRYLKLLEDFALYKENFRLIGLITRADEVLRELDGDNDVDID